MAIPRGLWDETGVVGGWFDATQQARGWFDADLLDVASAGVTGTLATTNANDTLSAAGTTTVTGTLARTNANDTSSASGTTTVVGTLAKTNADDTLAASGTVGGGGVSGTLAYTNANDTSAASGTTTVTGTVAYSNANDTAAANGWAGTISGTLAVSNANDTLAATGSAGSATPFPFGGVGLYQPPKRESEEQKRTRRIAQGIIRDAQKPAADLERLAKKASNVSAQLRADVAFYEAEAARYAAEIAQTKQAIALVMEARNNALATKQLEQKMIAAQLQAEAAAQQMEELDVVFMAVMLAALE